MHRLEFGCIAATDGNQVIHGLLMGISQGKIVVIDGVGKGLFGRLPHCLGRKKRYNSLYRSIK